MDSRGINRDDSICALATPMGGAIALIRTSGNDSISVVGKILDKDIENAKGFTLHHAWINQEDGSQLDEVLVAIYRSPHSYTGENSVEISCHGSPYIVRNILRLLTENGCRMALPGEFTQRAFLNGKMDLSQAEAVADLIASTGRAAHIAAISQLKGNFSSELKRLRERLLELTSLLELELDFSEEDVEFADRNELLELSEEIREKLENLAKSFKNGNAVKQGIPVAIVGRPNVGKSTLLNRLVGDDRAIVSDIPGTTRDSIEECIDINGLTFRFIDTAGIRKSDNCIEKLGIETTRKRAEKASIILWLTDEKHVDGEENEIMNIAKDKQLVMVRNKADLNDDKSLIPNYINISAKYGKGIDELINEIYRKANIHIPEEHDVIVTSARHYEALIKASEALENVINGLRNKLTSDLLSEHLREVISQLASITGDQITPEETLNTIFSRFCVGK